MITFTNPAAIQASKGIAPVSGGAPPSSRQQEIDAARAKYGITPVTQTPQTPPSAPVERSFMKNLVSAPATMIARPFQALSAAGDYIGTRMEERDATPEQQTAVQNAERDRELERQKDTGSVIAPEPKDMADVKKDVGRGVQTVAYGMGPVSGGAAFGFGNALEEGHDALSVPTAVETALGAAGGKLLGVLGKPIFNTAGKVVGKVTPEFLQDLAGKGTKAIQDFAEAHDIFPESVSKAINNGVDTVEKVANVPFDVAKKPFTAAKNAVENKISEVKDARIPGAIDDLEQSYRDIAENRIPTKRKLNQTDKATTLKDNAGTDGRTPQRVLAESGVIPEHNDMTFTTHQQADNIRNEVVHLSNANRKALGEVEQATQPILTQKLFDRAESRINAGNGTASDKKKMIAAAKQELLGLGEEVKITQLDAEKSAQWSKVKFDAAVPQLQRDYHYHMAKAMQEEIENVAKEAGHNDVAQINREIGDQLEAAKFLDSLDGRKVMNGQIGKHFLRLSGTILGSGAGPLGSISGALGGEAVSRMLASHSILSPVNRHLLRDLEAREPEVYAKVIEWIKQQQEARSSRLALPEGVTRLGGEEFKGKPTNEFENNFRNNSIIDSNIKKLPAPTPTIVTPNTQGTPNTIIAPYEAGGNKGRVGGVEQRLK